MPIVTRFPTTNSSDQGGGLSSPTNMYADDGSNTTKLLFGAGTASNLYATFGFDGQIPSGAIIVKVQIITENMLLGGGLTANYEAKIGSTLQATHYYSNNDGAYHVTTFDITADRSWVRADLLDGTFAVRVGTTMPGTGGQAGWDYTKVEVTYNLGENRFKMLI